MDGIDGRQGVYLIAATNRPDIIDRALLRSEKYQNYVLLYSVCCSFVIMCKKCLPYQLMTLKVVKQDDSLDHICQLYVSK